MHSYAHSHCLYRSTSICHIIPLIPFFHLFPSSFLFSLPCFHVHFCPFNVYQLLYFCTKQSYITNLLLVWSHSILFPAISSFPIPLQQIQSLLPAPPTPSPQTESCSFVPFSTLCKSYFSSTSMQSCALLDHISPAKATLLAECRKEKELKEPTCLMCGTLQPGIGQ